MSVINKSICFFTLEYPPTIGGISISADRVVKFLVDEGYKVTVVVPVNKNPSQSIEYNKEKIGGIEIYRFSAGPMIFNSEKTCINRKAVEHFFELSRMFISKLSEEKNFDIYHAFFLPLAYPIIKNIEEKRIKKPIIASIRGAEMESLFYEQWSSPYIKEVLEKADYVTTVNNDSLSLARTIHNVNEKSEVIQNSISRDKNPRWELNKNNKGVVGTLGNFRNKKDIPTLVRSYAKINSDIRRKLLLVGGFKNVHNQEKEIVLGEINNQAINNEVEITGFIKHSEINSYLNSMNVFVICSKEDGFPNALLEAIKAGVPIISTNIGGMKDILTNGENALLINPGDEESLTTAINRVLNSNSLANKLSDASIELLEKLDINQEKRKWINIYNRIHF